jgi:hypothetical protein
LRQEARKERERFSSERLTPDPAEIKVVVILD